MVSNVISCFLGKAVSGNKLVPNKKEWNKHPDSLTKEQFDNELKNEHVSISLDLKSHGLVCIDCDSEESATAMRKTFNGVKDKILIYNSSTKGHCHILLKASEYNTKKINLGDSFVHSEIEVLIQDSLIVCDGKQRVDFDNLLNFINNVDQQLKCPVVFTNFFDTTTEYGFWSKSHYGFTLIEGFQKIQDKDYSQWKGYDTAISGRHSFFVNFFTPQFARTIKLECDTQGFTLTDNDKINIFCDAFYIMGYASNSDYFQTHEETPKDMAKRAVEWIKSSHCKLDIIKSFKKEKEVESSEKFFDRFFTFDGHVFIKDIDTRYKPLDDAFNISKSANDMTNKMNSRNSKVNHLCGIKNKQKIDDLWSELDTRPECKKVLDLNVVFHFLNGYIDINGNFKENIDIFTPFQIYRNFNESLYNEGKSMPVVDEYIESMCNYNENRIKSLYALLGSMMSGKGDASLGIIYSTAGRTGKTTILETIKHFANKDRTINKIIVTRDGSTTGNGEFIGSGFGVSMCGFNLDDPPKYISGKAIAVYKAMFGGGSTRSLAEKYKVNIETQNYCNGLFTTNKNINFRVEEVEDNDELDPFKKRLCIVNAYQLDQNKITNKLKWYNEPSNFGQNDTIAEYVAHKAMYWYMKAKLETDTIRGEMFMYGCDDTILYLKKAADSHHLSDVLIDFLPEFDLQNDYIEIQNETIRSVLLHLIEKKLLSNGTQWNTLKSIIIQILKSNNYTIIDDKIKGKRGIKCSKEV